MALYNHLYLCTKLGFLGLTAKSWPPVRWANQLSELGYAACMREAGNMEVSISLSQELWTWCCSAFAFQGSKGCYSEARKRWITVLDTGCRCCSFAVNCCSYKKLESKQRPRDSNRLLHYSFLGHTEQSSDRQRSGDKHLDPRMDLNSGTVCSLGFPSGFVLLCPVQWSMGQRCSWQGWAKAPVCELDQDSSIHTNLAKQSILPCH